MNPRYVLVLVAGWAIVLVLFVFAWQGMFS